MDELLRHQKDGWKPIEWDAYHRTNHRFQLVQDFCPSTVCHHLRRNEFIKKIIYEPQHIMGQTTYQKTPFIATWKSWDPLSISNTSKKIPEKCPETPMNSIDHSDLPRHFHIFHGISHSFSIFSRKNLPPMPGTAGGPLRDRPSFRHRCAAWRTDSDLHPGDVGSWRESPTRNGIRIVMDCNGA